MTLELLADFSGGVHLQDGAIGRSGSCKKRGESRPYIMYIHCQKPHGCGEAREERGFLVSRKLLTEECEPFCVLMTCIDVAQLLAKPFLTVYIASSCSKFLKTVGLLSRVRLRSRVTTVQLQAYFCVRTTGKHALMPSLSCSSIR